MFANLDTSLHNLVTVDQKKRRFVLGVGGLKAQLVELQIQGSSDLYGSPLNCSYDLGKRSNSNYESYEWKAQNNQRDIIKDVRDYKFQKGLYNIRRTPSKSENKLEGNTNLNLTGEQLDLQLQSSEKYSQKSNQRLVSQGQQMFNLQMMDDISKESRDRNYLPQINANEKLQSQQKKFFLEPITPLPHLPSHIQQHYLKHNIWRKEKFKKQIKDQQSRKDSKERVLTLNKSRLKPTQLVNYKQKLFLWRNEPLHIQQNIS